VDWAGVSSAELDWTTGKLPELDGGTAMLDELATTGPPEETAVAACSSWGYDGLRLFAPES